MNRLTMPPSVFPFFILRSFVLPLAAGKLGFRNRKNLPNGYAEFLGRLRAWGLLIGHIFTSFKQASLVQICSALLPKTVGISEHCATNIQKIVLEQFLQVK